MRAGLRSRTESVRSGWVLSGAWLLQMMAGLAFVSAIGCRDLVDTGFAEVKEVGLSAYYVDLVPGESRELLVTVVRTGGSVRLTASGLPSWLRVTFSPEILSEGETRSILTVAADASVGTAQQRLRIVAAVAGDGGTVVSAGSTDLQVSVCPGYALPGQCPPFPTGGNNEIRGVVVERTPSGTRPIAGAAVWAWVQFPQHGYSAGRFVADASGEYRIAGLPNATIILQTGGAGYDQPCASTVELAERSAKADLEVVSQANPIASSEPAPPAVVGSVYETTPGGRQPVGGARVYFETAWEIVAATTTTDSLGRYSLCRLPRLHEYGLVTPVKDGYVLSPAMVSVSGVVQLDIEMRRQ